MTPVIALAEPDELFGGGQVMPVDSPVAALEKRGDFLLHDVADFPGGGAGDAENLLAMVAGGGDEGELRSFGGPLHIGPFGAAALDVVAKRRAVLVGGELEAHDARSVQIEDHALDGGHNLVARQRILP